MVNVEGVGDSNSNSHSHSHSHIIGNTDNGGVVGGGTVVVGDDLERWERRLRNEVDADFFEDSSTFRTLHRVIDILGSQLMDRGDENPAYIALKKQQQVVEAAIEHMAVHHCSDLNGSVVSVGRVARQFTEAVGRVRGLRRQVRDISSQLHHTSHHHHTSSVNSVNIVNSLNVNGNGVRSRGRGRGRGRGMDANGMPLDSNDGVGVVDGSGGGGGGDGSSLRELWLKKLESEAVLSLLAKLEVIREAPRAFDTLVSEARIGAAVTLLGNALETAFSDDVSQIPAATRITAQLTDRKQLAEELLWDALHDVIYLRTGNAPTRRVNVPGGGLTDETESGGDGGGATWTHSLNDADSVSSSHSSSSCGGAGSGSGTGSSRRKPITGRVVPQSVMDTELELEEDELVCLRMDEPLGGAFGSGGGSGGSGGMSGSGEYRTPKYSDPIVALRILVEAISRIHKLDDMERFLTERLETELKGILEKEQAKTLSLLERRKKINLSKKRDAYQNMAMSNLPFEFKHHMRSMLHAYGNVMLRLTYLAQILRVKLKVASDSPTESSIHYSECPSSALHNVLSAAYSIMQKEIKTYLSACLAITDGSSSTSSNTNNNSSNSNSNSNINTNKQSSSKSLLSGGKRKNKATTTERGIFTLGILDDDPLRGGMDRNNNSQPAPSSLSDLPSDQFVTTVMVPMTYTHPNFRFALLFRRRLERWTVDVDDLLVELATVTEQDRTAPSVMTKTEKTALQSLDQVIEKEVLPVLQELAVNCTLSAIDREDAFDARLENVYSRGHIPQEAVMGAACGAVLDATTPLFSALQHLPRGSSITPLVADLEMSLHHFHKRAKDRVDRLCRGKAAGDLLATMDGTGGGIAAAMEHRRAYSLLLQAYGERQIMELPSVPTTTSNDGAIRPLHPSSSDTQARHLHQWQSQSQSQTHSQSQSQIPTNPNHTSSGPSGAGLSVEPISEMDQEEDALEKEIGHLVGLIQFNKHNYGEDLVVCSEDTLLQAAYLAHSLLRFVELLEQRLKHRKGGNWRATTTRPLREVVGHIKAHGIHMAKFCRMDVLVQVVKHMSKICKDKKLMHKDQVRLPDCVNDLGEYLTTMSDYLREVGGKSIAAYALSSLEQYIPLLLMQTVRRIGRDGLPSSSKSHPGVLTLNGVEALDRCGSVLYRDLKGATSFTGSFWNDAAAADAFERSASFIALLELEMDDLEHYCRKHPQEFSEGDYKILFSMNGPKRKGNIHRYNAVKAENHSSAL